MIISKVQNNPRTSFKKNALYSDYYLFLINLKELHIPFRKKLRMNCFNSFQTLADSLHLSLYSLGLSPNFCLKQRLK